MDLNRLQRNLDDYKRLKARIDAEIAQLSRQSGEPALDAALASNDPIAALRRLALVQHELGIFQTAASRVDASIRETRAAIEHTLR